MEDVDALVYALSCVATGQYSGKYHQDIASGEYIPDGWVPEFDKYFSFKN